MFPQECPEDRDEPAAPVPSREAGPGTTIRDVIRQAFEEGYQQGVYHRKGASPIAEARRIAQAFWERVREEAEAKFPSPVSASAPSREAGTGTRRAQTNCQQEPHYPDHETVAMSLRYPMMTCHHPTDRCAIQEPHQTSECGQFTAAPLVSLGERPDDDVRRAIAGILQAAALHAIASPETTAAVDKAVAMYAALRSSLQEARADSERWRYIRQFLIVDRWELSPATTLNARMFKVPPIRGRSDATVDEIMDNAMRAAPLVEREESRR